MKRSKPIVALIFGAFLLGGCESLAGFGGGLVSLVGAGASESIEAKKAAIALWKVERARLMAKMTDRMEMEAEKKFAAGDYETGLAMLREILAFHDKNQPLWLFQQFIRKDDGKAKPTS